MTENPQSREARPALFDDMHLQVGDRLQIVLHRVHDEIHYATVVGWMPGRFLLVTVPTESGITVPMREGEALTVRAFSGAGVYSFDSVLDMIQLSPHFYMHLRFPKSINAIPLRDAPRIRVNLPAQVKTGPAAEPMLAIVSDLSISGASLTADRELGAPGDSITVTFTFSVKPTNQEIRLELHGVIRTVHGPGESGAANWHATGVHFDNASPNDLVMLQHFLYDAMGRGAQPAPSSAFGEPAAQR